MPIFFRIHLWFSLGLRNGVLRVHLGFHVGVSYQEFLSGLMVLWVFT